MKKDVQITTEILAVRQNEVRIRTVVIVIRGNGLRSTHEEVRWVKHFGDSVATNEAEHNRLAASMQKWVETGVTGPELLEYELE